jgi:uncharacterized protein (TIRG00374 family)
VKKPRFWISMAISALLLALALRRIQPAEVGQALAGTRVSLLLLAALARVILATARAYRWQILLTPATGLIPLPVLFRTWLIGFFGNYTLPSQSGEILKLYCLARRTQMSRSAILGTLFLERLGDVLVLSLALVALLLALPLPGWMGQLGWLAAIGWIVGLLLLLGLALRREQALSLTQRLLHLVLPGLADWGVSRMDRFAQGLSALRSLPVFARVLGLSIVVWAVQLVPFWLVGLAMGLSVPLYGYLALMVVFNLASLVPALPGRLGTLEFVFATVLVLFQGDDNLAISFAILFRLTHLLPLALGGVFFLGQQRSDDPLGEPVLHPPAEGA